MSDWANKILQRLNPEGTQKILVVDPYRITQFEKISRELINFGWNILRVESALDARIAFELQVLPASSRIMLCIHSAYKPRPDMKKTVQSIELDYAELFPYFDASVLKGLSFNALCTLDELRPYDVLGYEGTIRFILENLYSIDLNALSMQRSKERFLAILAEVVLHSDGVNDVIAKYIFEWAKQPLSLSIPQDISPEKVKDLIQKALQEFIVDPDHAMRLSDPYLFRVISSLIAKQAIPAVKIDRASYSRLEPEIRQLYYCDINAESESRIQSLTAYIETTAHTIQDIWPEWLDLATPIAELISRTIQRRNSEVSEKVFSAIETLNVRFQKFIDNSYWSLYSLSGTRRPVVVSRILDFMNAQSASKRALIVIDGMNIWQWYYFSQFLEEKGIHARNQALFAYLPSITAWSRQAIFKGAKPDLEVGNEVEENVFNVYWQNKGYAKQEIAYCKVDISKKFEEPSRENKISGYVLSDLDALMHGAVLGNEQLLNDSITWFKNGPFIAMIDMLLKRGYTIFITSDHGNIDAKGSGKLPASVTNLSRSRSKRYIEFTNQEDAQAFVISHPEMILGYRDSSVFVRDSSAFGYESSIISHGGSHLLELIVPLAIVERI